MRMQMDADLDAFAGKTGMDKEQLVEKLIMTVITLRGPLLIFIILIA